MKASSVLNMNPCRVPKQIPVEECPQCDDEILEIHFKFCFLNPMSPKRKDHIIWNKSTSKQT